ncbi:hypothetical protein BDK51DRAFT_15847, partial [Blyttiomyces helicus]
SVPNPADLDYLASPSHFSEYLREQHMAKHGRASSMDPAEISRRYEIYKENFINKQYEKFFNAEKENEWFREKYHPEESKKFLAQVSLRRHALLKLFLKDLDAGDLDVVCFDEPAEEPSSAGDEEKDKEKADEEKAEGTDPVAEDLAANGGIKPRRENILFIKGVGTTVKRKELEEICKKVDGFQWLALTDPRPEKRMARLGWIVFKEGTNLDAAFKSLENEKLTAGELHLSVHTQMPPRKRLAPSEANDPDRLSHDLMQIQRLASVLDAEVGITPADGAELIERRIEVLFPKDAAAEEDYMEEDEVGKEEGGSLTRCTEKVKKSLDLYIEYLRQVHTYDYYGGIEAASPEDLSRRTGTYLRQPTRAASSTTPTPTPSRKDWTGKLDTRVQLRITKPIDGAEILKQGGRSVEAAVDKALSGHVAKEGPGKYRCKECNKLFKGEEYVKKHLKAKHGTLATDAEAEATFFNCFMRDPCKPDLQRPGVGSAPPFTGAGGGAAGGGAGAAPVIMGPPVPIGEAMIGNPYGGPNPAFMQGGRGSRDYGRPMVGGVGAGMMRGGMGGIQLLHTTGDKYLCFTFLPARISPSSSRLPFTPLSSRATDPRQIRSYTDLDNVSKGDIDINYD